MTITHGGFVSYQFLRPCTPHFQTRNLCGIDATVAKTAWWRPDTPPTDGKIIITQWYGNEEAHPGTKN